MELNDFLVAIATLLAGILVYIQARKSDKNSHLYQEESEWRCELKKVISSLYNCRIEERKKLQGHINAVKILLNPKGRYNKYPSGIQYYMEDSHIWRVIWNLEKGWKNSDKLKLIKYLELLLKYDWEESKTRLKYNIFDTLIMFWICVQVMLFILWIIQPEWQGASGSISVIFPSIGLAMILCAGFMFYLKIKNKLYLGIKKPTILEIFLFCLLIPWLGLVSRYNEALLSFLTVYPSFVDINKNYMTFLLVGVIYIIEVIFLIETVSDWKNMYYSDIQKIDLQYLKREMKWISKVLVSDSNIWVLQDSNLQKAKQHSIERMGSTGIVQSQEITEELFRRKLIFLRKNYLLGYSSEYRKEVKYLMKYIKSKEKN
ncbi:hypothetical protein HO997_04165 [Streptococcus suis]|nr:hypothetical protein [Streptococcus suis]